jgi:hypothetical protein
MRPRNRVVTLRGLRVIRGASDAAVLSSDDYGSSVERRAMRQVLWRVRCSDRFSAEWDLVASVWHASERVQTR